MSGKLFSAGQVSVYPIWENVWRNPYLCLLLRAAGVNDTAGNNDFKVFLLNVKFVVRSTLEQAPVSYSEWCKQ